MMNDIKKIDSIKKIVDTIFSVKTGKHCKSVYNWVNTLVTTGFISKSEGYGLRHVLVKHCEQIVQHNKKLIEVRENQYVSPEITRDMNKLVEGVIFDYFTKIKKVDFTRKYCYNAYDLPLCINLIESDITKNEIKVYLQRPGLLIGKGGQDITEIERLVSEKVDNIHFKILIIETRGKTRIRYNW